MIKCSMESDRPTMMYIPSSSVMQSSHILLELAWP